MGWENASWARTAVKQENGAKDKDRVRLFQGHCHDRKAKEDYTLSLSTKSTTVHGRKDRLDQGSIHSDHSMTSLSEWQL